MLEWVVVVEMSLMYSMKNVVDSVLPCGMPCVMICGSDCVWSVCRVWILFWKYDARSLIVLVSKLKLCCNLWSNLECEMVSYALDRSK